MIDTTAPATTICPTCKGEVAADALKCRHCAEWLPGRSPAFTAGPAAGLAPAQSKSRAPMIIAIVAGAVVALILLVVVGSMVLVSTGDSTPEPFKSTGQTLG